MKYLEWLLLRDRARETLAIKFMRVKIFGGDEKVFLSSGELYYHQFRLFRMNLQIYELNALSRGFK